MPKKINIRRKHPPYSFFKGYLVEKGIKLKQLAEILNTTVTCISQKNNGFSDYSIQEVNKICDALGCEMSLFRTKKVS
jgi:DNA-binding Xre family transcriptional regulator